jgi:microcystin-dependent protein
MSLATTIKAALDAAFGNSDFGDERQKVADGVRAALPAGTVLPFAGAAAPAGFLLCNGQSVLRSAYAALFAIIGTTYGAADADHFTVPDLRGEFIRGLDGGRGVDAGRTLGSAQAADFASHTHQLGVGANDNTAIVQGTKRHANFVNDAYNFTPAHSSTAAGGTETRPRNVALNFIIAT